MNRVIGKKRYNTERSQLVGSYGKYSQDEATSWAEHLYRKRNGEFFLHGEGGEMTKYAQAVGQNEWKGGEKIMPLTVERAREWAEKHLSVEAYEKVFGVVEDDDSKRLWTVNISPSTLERIRRAAGEQNTTLSEVVENAIAAYLR